MGTKLFLGLGLLMIGLAGCVKQPEERNALNTLPQWYQEPTALGDKYAAAGSAKSNNGKDIELQKIEAAAVARAELARQMQLRVKDMYKRATQELGIGEDQTIDHAVQYATKQVADVTLERSLQKKLFLDSETGVLYTLYTLDPAIVDQKLKNTLQTSLKNDEALWQKFQSTQVWKELDNETKQ